MKHSTVFSFLLVALSGCSVVGETIDHLVVHEKIDRAGNVQDGGAGEADGESIKVCRVINLSLQEILARSWRKKS